MRFRTLITSGEGRGRGTEGGGGEGSRGTKSRGVFIIGVRSLNGER